MTADRKTVVASADALAPLQSFLAEFWSRHHLPDGARFPFELALEEIFMNVVMHGSHARTDVWSEVAIEQNGDLTTMTLRDNGNPFDPLAAPTPDLDAAMEDRPIGGLGIHLIRTMMDDVEYRWTDGCNELVLRKRLDEVAPH